MLTCGFLIHTDFPGPCDEPNYAYINRITDMLVENYQALFSMLGGGMFGFIGAILPGSFYGVFSNVPFIFPRHQDGPTIPANVSPQEERSIRASHESDQ